MSCLKIKNEKAKEKKGFAGFPPEGYAVYNKDGEHVFVPCA